MIEDYFIHTADHKPFASYDWKNRKTFDSTVTLDCRWRSRNTRVVDPDTGTEVVSENQVVVAPDVTLTMKDEFVRNSKTYRVAEIRQGDSFEAVKQTVVLL